MAQLLAKEMLPESWIPPEEIQRLRDRTRLRKAIAEDRRRWGQRLHAYLLHEGRPCSKTRLLTPEGLRWVAALRLPVQARVQADSLLAAVNALGAKLETLDEELRRFARSDACCRALQTIYGVGPTLACHLLAEIGEAAASAAASRSPGWPDWIRSLTSPARRVGGASSPRPAHRIFVGRSSRPPCTRTGRPRPTLRSTARPASAATPPSPD